MEHANERQYGSASSRLRDLSRRAFGRFGRPDAMVPVGNPGNLNDGTGYGAVPYTYNIGTKDVTASQYVEFLNAKDAGGTNTLFLYNSSMSNATFGEISFVAGNLPGFKYGVIGTRGDHPANYTTWYNASSWRTERSRLSIPISVRMDTMPGNT